MEGASFFEVVSQGMARLTWGEILAVVFGLIYVILAARENIWCWFWGILSSGLWAYVTYVQFDLIADSMLNIFYVIMGFIGWHQWRYGRSSKAVQLTEMLPVSTLPFYQHVLIFVAGSVMTLVFGYFFETYTAAAATYLDSFTTIFAIVATFLTVRKILENWLYWIAVDALYIYLYLTRGGYLFALLFVLYCGIAVAGYISWKKKMKATGVG